MFDFYIYAVNSEALKGNATSETEKRSWWQKFRDGFSIIVKSSGLIMWFIIFLLALLEIKRYYNIDVIPGYNSSIDNVYGATRGTLSEFFKSFD